MTDSEQETDEDGYPVLPAYSDWEAFKRHANIRVLAEVFRMDGESFGLPPEEPMTLWKRAERAWDENRPGESG